MNVIPEPRSINNPRRVDMLLKSINALILDTSHGEVVSEDGYQTLTSEFDPHWVPYTSGFVLN